MSVCKKGKMEATAMNDEGMKTTMQGKSDCSLGQGRHLEERAVLEERKVCADVAHTGGGRVYILER